MNKLKDVFKLSGIPTHTFVKPQEYLRLTVALDTIGRGLVIEGPSGIGKTTSIIKALTEISEFSNPRLLSARKAPDLIEIKNLPKNQDFGLVIIDDFHRLDTETKEEYANLLKVLADEESENCKLVLVGINKTGQPLLNIARDLRNRIDLIKFESNPEEKILELLELGEQALNIDLATKSEISSKSEGSFHIAQMLAHRACILADFSQQENEKIEVNTSFETVKGSVLDDLALSFYDLAKLFCAGQRVKKGSRGPYLHVLNWLSQEQDWSLNIRNALATNPNHKQSVGQIIDRGHLKGHLDSNQQLDEVIFYDDTSSIISIEDPKFAYYIKNLSWSNFARSIGFPTIEFGFKYDYALSFAGTQRELAADIFSKLSENEISAFYDLHEQHRILAASVEEYLAPIYSSESKYVIALLSQEYPQRIWCKFESEQFKHRFGENAVIPIWFKGNFPGFFDTTAGVGGMNFDGDNHTTEQVERICETLINKIHDDRLNS